ncbi:hypothetical protein ABZ802_25565 [Streptomyces sp. NPDC047737]|jgi:hypothetical protein
MDPLRELTRSDGGPSRTSMRPLPDGYGDVAATTAVAAKPVGAAA